MNISLLSQRIVAPIISSLEQLSIIRYWLLIVGYISIAAITIQFLILPVFLKDYHWGGGFLDIRDAITYHTVSKEVASRINDHGLSEWSLKPRSNRDDLRIKSGISGIVSLIYAYTVPELWTIIPFNAVVHATTALVLLKIFLLLGMSKSWAMFATLPFVFYPSSAQWWSQIGKDGVLILGIFLVFYSFLLGIKSSKGRQFVYAILSAMLGFFLIWLMREYMIILFSMFSLFAIAVYVVHSLWIKSIFSKLFVVSYVVLLCCMLVFFNNTGFIVDQKPVLSVAKAEKLEIENISGKKLIVDSKGLTIRDGQLLREDGSAVRISGRLKVENGNVLLNKRGVLSKNKEDNKVRVKVDDAVLKAKDSLLNQTGNKLNARDSVDVARDNEIDNGNALFSRSSELSENKEDDAVLRTGDGLLNQIDGVVLEKDVVIVEVDNELFIVSAQDYNKILSEEKRFEVRDYVPRIVRPYYDHITLIANNLYQRFSNKSDSLVANLGHKISISINGVRKNFDGDYRTASSVDESVRFHNMSDLINYLPRALQIGLFAPFPDQWLEPGSSEPNTIMRKVAIFEMSFFYLSLVFLLLNIKRVLRNPGIL